MTNRETSSGRLLSNLITVKEFHALVEDGTKADLIEGVVYIASPDTLTNDQIGGFLFRLMGSYCEVKDLGKVFGSRFAFILSPIRAPEPDVAFVKKDRLHLVHELGMEGGPDIAVEIVSRESRQRDYVEKKQLYQEAAVPEYWLIDPLQKRAEFYGLQDGRYELVPLSNNRIFRSDVLESFYVDVEWLFSETLPKAYEKLQEILASVPKSD